MVTRPKISLDEEKITKPVKEIFEEELKKQEVNITDVEKKISTFEIKMDETYDYQIEPDYVNDSLLELQDKISKMEDRSRWNNIGVDGVTEEKGETWEDCENKFLKILKDKLEIENVTTERAHRIKPYQNKKITKVKPHLGQ